MLLHGDFLLLKLSLQAVKREGCMTYKKSPAGNEAKRNSSRSYSTKKRRSFQINYTYVNALALSVLPSILSRWLPNGKVQGNEYITCNPKRYDRNAGSFKINLRTGKWADFATGDKGGDIISLAAFLSDMKQSEAAKELLVMLGGENV